MSRTHYTSSTMKTIIPLQTNQFLDEIVRLYAETNKRYADRLSRLLEDLSKKVQRYQSEKELYDLFNSGEFNCFNLL